MTHSFAVCVQRLSICLGLAGWLASSPPLQAETLVPGTGEKLANVGDDFEDPNWVFNLRLPKSSEDIDKSKREPLGRSDNGHWFESSHRGIPDIVQRVETPSLGIPGSTGALMIRSLNTGVPGRYSNTVQQDDLVGNTRTGSGNVLPVGWRPSVVVRVYMPAWDEWEQRVGTGFALRANCTGGKRSNSETYWPGIFIQRNSPGRDGSQTASLIVRAKESGQDFPAMNLMEPGWLTLGMSFTPDGAVHYYAREGVDDLTEQDHIASNYPYGYRTMVFQNFFFNVANMDNGRSWSTAWVIDDPAVYCGSRPAQNTVRSNNGMRQRTR